MQCESRDGAIWGTEVDGNAQDPRMWSVPGRMLRVGITSIIQHAGLLDAKEQNRIEQNRTEQNSIIQYNIT